MASGQPNSMVSDSSTFIAGPFLPGVELGVKVDGKLLTLHRDPNEEGETANKIIRYVEVKTGQSFAIALNILDADQDIQWFGDALQAKFSINKEDFGNHYYAKERYAGRTVCKMIDHVLLRNGNRAIPKFTAIVQDEDASTTPEELELAENVGCFTVRLTHVQNVSVKPKPRRAVNNESSSQRSVVTFSEKSMKGKAVSHTVDFVEEEPRQRSADSTKIESSAKDPKACEARRETIRIVLDDHPHGSIEFRYRSREALEALCIVPRQPAEQLYSSDIDAAQLPSSPPVLKKEKSLSCKMRDDLEEGDRPRKKARLADGKTS